MSRETWQEQLRRGSLDLAILLTVATGPRYGLSIIQHLEAFTDLVVTEGTIYPILGRLTRDGLLEAQWVEGEAPQQLLTITLKPRTPRGRALSGLRRISRPGLRVYARVARVRRKDRPVDDRL